MKRFIALCMTGIMLMSSNAFAEGIVYNNEPISYTSQAPVIIDSRTYVPIRDVFEKLGFEVEWDAETKLVNISNDYYNIVLTTGTSKIFVVDISMSVTAQKLENTVKIINSKTMLPLREILEKVGYELEWDAESKTTTIVDKNDYTALQAKYDLYKNIENVNFEYEVDSTKPVGKLTDEEKAYLTNLYTFNENEKYKDMAVNMSDLTKAQTEKLVKEVMAIAKADLSSVECPESLKNVDSSMKASLDKMGDLIINMSSIEEMLEGETDNVKSKLGFSLGMIIVVAAPMAAYDMAESIKSFYEERNIDPEAELGDVYKPLVMS